MNLKLLSWLLFTTHRIRTISQDSGTPIRYSPELRTALVFTGTGTFGAYHAGVIKAVQEAGVKIDLVAGRGIGAISAMFAAIDGGEHLWNKSFGWPSSLVSRLYPWRWTLKVSTWILGVAFLAILFPLVVLCGGILVFPLGFLLRLSGFEVGAEVASWYTQIVEIIFQPHILPLYLPRFVTSVLLLLLITLAGGVFVRSVKTRLHRRARGSFWWNFLGSPLSISRISDWASESLWRRMRGAARIGRPSNKDLSERYAQLLIDNLGQPGYRELIMLVHDIDGRRDLVSALLSEKDRRYFFSRSPNDESRDRHLETVDLAGAGCQYVVDIMMSALGVPLATKPHLISFPKDSAWHGEVHRLADRPESTGRLLEEVAHAGAEQVILVTAAAEIPGPHNLNAERRDARGKVSEYLTSLESASVRDALVSCAGYFQGVFQVRPSHNPLGMFDFEGCYDESSDRNYSLKELVDLGYEDARRQFVDSVVGASGEWIDSENRR